MKLHLKKIKDYRHNGFLLIKNIFFNNELDIIEQALSDSIGSFTAEKFQGMVLEENNTAIRTINGVHLENKVFLELCRHPNLLLPAQQLLGDNNLYVHQFKINFKEPFVGDVWEWHQDYIYWLKGDGMPEPKAISVALLLDDVTEFNAPLMFIPQSHKIGVIDVSERSENINDNQQGWISNVTAKLKYPAPRDIVTKLTDKFGLVAPKAPKGSILFFDGNILHASTVNLSPFPRRSILVTYNPVSNVNMNFSSTRPEFLASRNYIPITPSPSWSSLTKIIK